MKELCYIAILLGSLSCNVEVCGEIISDQNVTGFHDETKVKGSQTVLSVENVTEIFDEINSAVKNNSEKIEDEIDTRNNEVKKIIYNEINSTGDDIDRKHEEKVNSDVADDSIQDSTDKTYSTEGVDVENHEEINKNKVRNGSRKQIIKLFSKEDEERVKEIFSSKEENNYNILNEIHASDYASEDVGGILNSTVYSTVNNYYCIAAIKNETKLILYGSKSWTFPLQDVNLTLTYPIATPDNATQETSTENVDYIITGFKVVLYIDGVQTKGYINSGGVKQSKISLSFVSSGISSLMYQFWLYGIPRDKADVAELHAMYFMCS